MLSNTRVVLCMCLCMISRNSKRPTSVKKKSNTADDTLGLFKDFRQIACCGVRLRSISLKSVDHKHFFGKTFKKCLIILIIFSVTYNDVHTSNKEAQKQVGIKSMSM